MNIIEYLNHLGEFSHEEYRDLLRLRDFLIAVGSYSLNENAKEEIEDDIKLEGLFLTINYRQVPDSEDGLEMEYRSNGQVVSNNPIELLDEVEIKISEQANRNNHLKKIKQEYAA